MDSDSEWELVHQARDLVMDSEPALDFHSESDSGSGLPQDWGLGSAKEFEPASPPDSLLRHP